MTAFLFLAVIFLSAGVTLNQPEYFAHKYRLKYAIWVIEAENQTETPPSDVHICQQTADEKLQMCREAMQYPMAIENKIRAVEGPAVGEGRTYEIKLGGQQHFNKTPVFYTACLCPSNPPIYLGDNSSGVFVDAYLAFRQEYGEIADLSVSRKSGRTFSWYERSTTVNPDIEPPDVEYLEVMFQATEMLISLTYQLKSIRDAYDNADWTHIRVVNKLPEIFNRTTSVIDRVNRTLERTMDRGFHQDRELADPIDKVTIAKLTECFQEMKKYVDRFQAERGLQDKDLRSAAIEMRLQINTAIQELGATGPELMERMRMIRDRVTKGPY